MRWIAAWCFLLVGFLCPAQPSETTPTLPLRQSVLRLGYLPREATGHPREATVVGLRAALEEDPELRAALTAAGYARIGLFPCDGPADMRLRLDAREFDIAFTPANLFVENQAEYTAILKARRAADFIGPQGIVLSYGVVFVTKASPLFHKPTITAADVSAVLQRERFGVVAAQSVVGFQAPLRALALEYGLTRFDAGFAFFESSEEVARGVLSGLVAVGACERSALDAVLGEAGLTGRSKDVIRVLATTEPIITDPIVVRRGLAPRTSPLGRALRDAIRRHSQEGKTGPIQYLPSSDEEYRGVAGLLEDFRRRFGEVPR